MKSLYMKKNNNNDKKRLRRLFAVKHIGQSSFYRAYVTTPATGSLRR